MFHYRILEVSIIMLTVLCNIASCINCDVAATYCSYYSGIQKYLNTVEFSRITCTDDKYLGNFLVKTCCRYVAKLGLYVLANNSSNLFY